MEIISQYLINVWIVTKELAPWLLFGAVIAGLLHVFMPPNFVRDHLGKGNLRNVVKASLLGVPMPLCSCGVIPTAIGLKKDGASNGSAIAFLISTPQTGVDSITVSAVFLGIPFALFKVASAFIAGIIGGVIVNFGDLRQTSNSKGESPRPPRQRCRSIRECGSELLEFAVHDLLYGIWRWIVIGIIISAAIMTFIPAGALAEKAWATGLTGMFLMLLISLPLYVCATASVPIAASLVIAGMPAGTALVFLLAGPATNAATLGAVIGEFGKRITAVYLTTIATVSILAGLAFNKISDDRIQIHEITTGHLEGVEVVSGLLLAALFAYFLYRDIRFWRWEQRQQKIFGEEQINLRVGGMACETCVHNIQLAVSAQNKVEKVDVDLEHGLVTVHGHGFHPENIREAVREAGYEVLEMQDKIVLDEGGEDE